MDARNPLLSMVELGAETLIAHSVKLWIVRLGHAQSRAKSFSLNHNRDSPLPRTAGLQWGKAEKSKHLQLTDIKLVFEVLSHGRTEITLRAINS